MTTLSKDEIVKMAREAGAVFDPQWGIASNTGTATFERFATICRADLVAELEAAIERADELGADKGTYFRLYEQACIQMTEKDKYAEHYRTLFNNADEANNRLIDERDALRAEVERLKKDLSTYDKRIVALSCIAMEDVHELLALQAELADWKARALKAEQAGEPFGWYSAKEDDFMLDKIRKTHERLNSHTHRIGKYDTALFTAPQPAAQEPVGVFVSDAEFGRIDLVPHHGAPMVDGQAVYATPPSAVPVVRQMVEALERKLPGGKQTDDFESSRIGDYNQGWNDYRKAVKKMFKNINMNSSENSNPDAYLYSLEYGEKVVDTKVSIHQLNYPFGVAGADYLVRNDDGVSYVRQTKLYAALSHALAAGQKFIKENCNG